MATMGRNLYNEEQMAALRDEYEGTSFGDHVASVMNSATDDVKSVVVPVVDAVGVAVRSVTRDVAFFIAGAFFTIVVQIVSHFI